MTEKNTMADETTRVDGVPRRTILKVSAIGVGSLGMAAHDHGDDDDNDDHENEANGNVVDKPEGFEVNILAEHAPFVDSVAARFCLNYADTDDDPIVVDLEDAGTVIVGEVIWHEGARSDWHRHPG